MSNWESIDLTKVSPTLELIKENKEGYTYQLFAASYDPSNINKAQVTAFVVDDGEFTGRRVYFSYPDPIEYPWAKNMFVRLAIAVGQDILPGEGPVAYVNRVAKSYARFKAPLLHRTYKDKNTGEDRETVDVDIKHPRPAA